jgi:iron complex outermembrane recepter protein
MRSAIFNRFLALTFLATTSPSAFAQTVPAEDESGLGEIIVTAQRRDENLQDVPLSVTAVGGEKLGNISAAGAQLDR